MGCFGGVPFQKSKSNPSNMFMKLCFPLPFKIHLFELIPCSSNMFTHALFGMHVPIKFHPSSRDPVSRCPARAAWPKNMGPSPASPRRHGSGGGAPFFFLRRKWQGGTPFGYPVSLSMPAKRAQMLQGTILCPIMEPHVWGLSNWMAAFLKTLLPLQFDLLRLQLRPKCLMSSL